MKHFISLLMIVLVTLFCGTASAFTVPAYNGFVNDYSGKLSAHQVEALNKKAQEVNQRTANEIGVMIINSLGGESIEDVTHETFKVWKVGKAGLDNGVLLVIALNDRKMRIETGKGVEGDLTDLQTQDIQDHMKPLLRQGNLNGAVSLAINEIGSSIESRREARKNGVASGTGNPKPVSCQASAVGSSGTGLGLLLIGIFAVAVILVVRYARRKSREEMERLQAEADRIAAQYLARQKKHIEAVKPEVKKETLTFPKENVVLPSPLYTASAAKVSHAPKSSTKKPAKRSSSPAKSSSNSSSGSSSSSSSSSYSPSSSYDSGSSWSSGGGYSGGGGDFGGGSSGGGGSSSDW